MRVHPRAALVRRAKLAMDAAVTTIADEHELTYAEALQCLVEIQGGLLKYALRAERHPGREDALGADEACTSACAHP